MKPHRITLAALTVAAAGVAAAEGCGHSNGIPLPGAGGDAGAPGEAGAGSDGGPAGDASVSPKLAAAREKIRHVIVINQENRSFDHYFGTFPGADGIPTDGGVPAACSVTPDGGCARSFHEPRDENFGGPHGSKAHAECVADGGMNGFVLSALAGAKRKCKGPNDPLCTAGADDIMGYHDDREIPNYWAYAKAFVLQDHMFEPVASFSLPDHLYMVSGWSAKCTPPSDPTACVTDLHDPGGGGHLSQGGGVRSAITPEYAWTDITHLLHAKGVPWSYFVAGGKQPDCEDGSMTCDAGLQDYKNPSYWNVLPWFDDVKADGELGSIADTGTFFTNLASGKLAAVNWLVPSQELSEHPPALVSRGQAYVTNVINAVMKSPEWKSTVIFVTWDDWGGFYDHVVPVSVDAEGYGLRVPGLTISPWVKPHVVDHRLYSSDAYLRFIEDIFVDGARLDPARDGRPDNRPTVRETVPGQGDLLDEFDFTQTPNPPLVLPPCPSGVDTVFSDAGPCKP